MQFDALAARWASLPARARIGLGVAIAAIALLTALIGVISHPNRSALFAGPLHPDQLSEVEERLASWNVAFTPTADNVLVESSRRNTLLLRLSLSGVPRAHVDTSDDVLGKLGAMTPQSVIDAQTRDGLAGDIEVALRGIDGVADARVIIAPAKPGYFADDTSKDASASVRLRLQAGARISDDAVAGMRSFVAASVPGLDARNVTIVDDRGVALGESRSDGDGSDLARSLQTALDAALGSGATIVRVRAEYDRRTITTHDVRRSALSPLSITASTQNERYVGGDKRYDRSEQQIDRGSETRETTAAAQGGRLAKISAAVFVDAARVGDIAAVRALAAATLGIDERRGDTLAVQALSFPHAALAKKDAWWLAYGALVPLLPTLVVCIAILVALAWARAPIGVLVQGAIERTNKRHRAVQAALPSAGLKKALAQEPAHTAAAIISALPDATAAAILETYPEHERAAIIRRMQRPHSPLVAAAERFIADA